MELEKFEEAIKEIDRKKYHIGRAISFEDGKPYISQWDIFRKDMSTEEYFDSKNLAILSSRYNNTIEDIIEFVKTEKIPKKILENKTNISEEEALDNLIFFNEGDYMTKEMVQSKNIVIGKMVKLKADLLIAESKIYEYDEIIAKLQEETTKLKAVNYKMAKFIAGTDVDEEICQKVDKQNCDSMAYGECENCIIDFFTKQIKGE